MAGSTRLELATSGVTGRRSNQLNYDPALTKFLKAIRGQTTGHQKRCHTREAPAPSGETKVPPCSKRRDRHLGTSSWWAVQDSNL